MENENQIKMSREETSPLRGESSITLVKKTFHTGEIGTYDLTYPSTCLIVDRSSCEDSVNYMKFKVWLLYAETEEILNELHRRFINNNGQWETHLSTKVCTDNNKLLTCPSIKLGNITKLTLDTTPNENHSRTAFASTNVQITEKFTKEIITMPSDILNRINKEFWEMESLPMIPSFSFDIFTDNKKKCQATFKIRVETDNNPEAIFEYATFVDNKHIHQDALRSAISASQNILQAQRNFIIAEMDNVEKVITLLIEAKVLNHKDKNNLSGNQNDVRQWIGELVDILKYTQNGLQSFITALEESGSQKNGSMAEKLRLKLAQNFLP